MHAVHSFFVAPPVVALRARSGALIEHDPNMTGIHSDRLEGTDDAPAGVQSFEDAGGNKDGRLVVLILTAGRAELLKPVEESA